MSGPFDLSLVVGGTRLGSDERDGTRIPSDLTFTTNAEGGCTTLSCSLLREVRDDGPERLGDLVRPVDGRGQSAWVGRLTGKSRTVDSWTQQQTAQAQGLWQAAEDDQSVRFLGIDRDLGRWQAATAQRQAVNAGAYAVRAAGPEDGGLKFDGSGAWATSNGRPIIMGQYLAGPVGLGSVFFNPATQGMGTDWLGLYRPVDPITGIPSSSPAADWITATPDGAGAATHPEQLIDLDGAQGVELQVRHESTSASEASRWAMLRNVGVVGDHGLTLHGTGAADYGLKASDMIRHWIDRFAPRLAPGQIVDSGLPIQHFAPFDPTTVADLVRNANGYHAWSFGVWQADSAGRGLVDFHPYGEGPAKTWIVRAGGDGVELAQDGDNLADLWTRVVVAFQTPDGKALTVGPTGAQTTHTSSELEITDPSHPLVAAGIDRTYLFQLQVPTTLEVAEAVGNVMLGQLNAVRHTGTCTLTGMVEDDRGHQYPAWMVRGGDSIRVVNQPDTAPRLVAEATYTHASRSVQCQLGTSLQTVEAIVAHLGARTTGRI